MIAMRVFMIAVALALCLTGCAKHANGRYDAVKLPAGIRHRIDAHGNYVVKVAEGKHARWLLVHPDGARDPVTGLPDDAQGMDINDKDELTGYFNAPGCSGGHCPSHAFIWSKGSMRDLGTLGGSTARPFAIDNNGEIAGSLEVTSAHPAHCSSSAEHSEFHPFIYSNGKISDLGAPPGYCGSAMRINDRGDALVTYTRLDDTGRQVEFSVLYRDGKIVTLPGNGKLTAYEINQAGDIVGSLATPDGYYHAVVVRNGGSMQDLGTGGYCCSDALGIDDSGALVGYVDTGNSSQDTKKHNILHAVMFRDGKVVDLNGLIDWSAGDRAKKLVAGLADFIGNDGEILCQVYDAQGAYVGMYILRPEEK